MDVDIADDVAAALDARRPVVALESTLLAHGLRRDATARSLVANASLAAEAALALSHLHARGSVRSR